MNNDKLIAEQNIVIAEFMQLTSAYQDVQIWMPNETIPKWDAREYFLLRELKYHTSWDWQIQAYSKAMHTFRDIVSPLEKDEHLCTMYTQLGNAYDSAIFTNNVQYGFDTIVKIIKIINNKTNSHE